MSWSLIVITAVAEDGIEMKRDIEKEIELVRKLEAGGRSVLQN